MNKIVHIWNKVPQTAWAQRPCNHFMCSETNLVHAVMLYVKSNMCKQAAFARVFIIDRVFFKWIRSVHLASDDICLKSWHWGFGILTRPSSPWRLETQLGLCPIGREVLTAQLLVSAPRPTPPTASAHPPAPDPGVGWRGGDYYPIKSTETKRIWSWWCIISWMCFVQRHYTWP
jgi:hypothetical protein